MDLEQICDKGHPQADVTALVAVSNVLMETVSSLAWMYCSVT